MVESWFEKYLTKYIRGVAMGELSNKITSFATASLSVSFRDIFRDIYSASKILPGLWTLYAIILGLEIVSLFVWFNGLPGLSFQDILLKILKYLGLAAILLVIFLYLIKAYSRMDGRKVHDSSEAAAQFYVFYSTLDAISYLADFLMIGLIKRYGFWKEASIIIPLFFAICVWTLVLYDKFLSKGYDLLQIRYVMRSERRIIKWTLRGKGRVFWLGSILLDPDIVTLLLRKEEKTTLRSVVMITGPSTLINILVWSVVYYWGLQGYSYFKWFVE